MPRLGEETIRKMLKDSGLTEKEAEIYVFLAKHEAMKGTEIARLTKTAKSQIFRLLKKLQAKSYVESTLEFPPRYMAVPFENVLSAIIRAKREEVAFIEKSKKDLLDHLRRKSQAEPSLEKFSVIKGNKKIYSKIAQMTRDTKHTLSAAATFPSLVRADQFGIFDDAFNHPLRSQIQYRFLTELSEQNLNAAEAVLKRTLKAEFNFRARNPDLGLTLFPRMVARDNEEILFFITPRTEQRKKEDVCLWTNCNSLVRTFTAVFDDLWRNSTDIQEKIVEIETGKPTPTTPITADAETIEEKYEKTLRAAKKEIIMMISSKDLVKFCQSNPPFKEWAKHSVSVKIMAPITKENFGIAEQLPKICEIRHAAESQFGTTVVDGKHLFQFKTPSTNQEEPESASSLKKPLYSDDPEYVGKVKVMLDDLWRNARASSPITLESIIQSSTTGMNAFSGSPYLSSKPDSPFRKMVFKLECWPEAITEKEVISKIVNAKKHPVKNPLKDKAVFYGRKASAVIHPPNYLNLPEMIISVFHWNEKSSFGPENWMRIHLWLDTPKGNAFMPMAHIQHRSNGVNFVKAVLADTPAAKNIQVIKQDEFQVQTFGNTLFVGWTKPIPLLPPKYTLPPSCILWEGYGKVRNAILKAALPSGFKDVFEHSISDAFVTFFHPSSKYQGPGTEGTLSRELIFTEYPPENKRKNDLT